MVRICIPYKVSVHEVKSLCLELADVNISTAWIRACLRDQNPQLYIILFMLTKLERERSDAAADQFGQLSANAGSSGRTLHLYPSRFIGTMVHNISHFELCFLYPLHYTNYRPANQSRSKILRHVKYL